MKANTPRGALPRVAGSIDTQGKRKMKVWKLSTDTPEMNTQWFWFSNYAEAKRAAVEHKKAYANDPSTAAAHEITLVEIPTKKKALIEWLNVFAPDGNG